MGNYNPDSPIILGEQWVGIRDEDLNLSPATNFVEVGHSFTLAQSRVLQEGRYYVNEIPGAGDRGQNIAMAIYCKETEDLSGPIRSVIIPVSIASVTGGSINGAATGAAALLSPTDGSISFNASSASTMGVRMSFAVGTHPELNGKRILGLNMLYRVTGDDSLVGPGVDGATSILMTTEFGATASNSVFYGRLHSSPTNQILRVPFGEVNHFWTATSPLTSTDRMHWTYSQILRFDTTTPWLFVTFNTGTSINAGAPAGTSLFVLYVALEVFYCEEQRVAFGGIQLGGAGGTAGKDSVYGANIITLRQMDYTANPVLTAGEYTAVITSPFDGDSDGSAASSSNAPTMNAERQLYAISSHTGVQVNLPFPMDETALNKTFTKDIVDVLPQLSVHTSGGPLTEVHAYGRQAYARVYGSFTATQEILDSVAGASYAYPWVRYYARRFGDTTVPLKLDSASPSVSGSGMAVFLSPQEWDALPEIVDGWKQITLRFPTSPTMGSGTTPTWRWSATGETAGNRWEVLGCIAPALSGTPNSLLTLAPAPHQLGTATYGAPSAGTTVNFGWITGYAPTVTATTDDSTTDGVLIFSQDMPAVSAFAVQQLTQAISGIGQDCGIDPCCIPTGIFYNRLTWTPDVNVDFDNFARVSASDWGTSLSGHLWSNQGGAATDHTTNGVYGQHSMPSLGNPRRDVLTGPFLDTDAQVTASVPVRSTGAALQTGLLLRNQDSANHYEANIMWNTDLTVSVRLVSRIAGVATTLAETTVGWYTPGDFFTIKARIDGTNFYAKAWKVTDAEPDFWQVTAVTTTITASGGTGVRSEAPVGNTNTLPVVASYYAFATTPVTSFYYEIQRQDTVDTDWHTIMLGAPLVSGFNDYEARPGIVSSYRMREINTYGFYGPWTSTLTTTLTSPGITGGCTTGGHVLIFTTNERQDGSSNLAYSSVWEQQVSEDFAFSEANFVQLQAMYNRDFFTAFRPLERGGDSFSRTVLVQAAAIAPPTLPGFQSLQDMAWDTVSYICVRDEDGNRWFATVAVPAGKVVHFRRLYQAQVNIVEVTDTPSQVHP